MKYAIVSFDEGVRRISPEMDIDAFNRTITKNDLIIESLVPVPGKQLYLAFLHD